MCKVIETIILAIAPTHDVLLTIIGDGPLYPTISGMIKQMNLDDRVRLIGRCSRERVKNLLDESDALVLGSLYEGLSHTIIEAMARGIPCIVSNRGGNVETISHGIDGMLLPPCNPIMLRSQIEKMRDDENFRYTLALNAYKNSTKYQMENTVTDYINAIQ